VAGEAVELGEPAGHVGGLVLDDLDDVKRVRNRRHHDCLGGQVVDRVKIENGRYVNKQSEGNGVKN